MLARVDEHLPCLLDPGVAAVDVARRLLGGVGLDAAHPLEGGRTPGADGTQVVQRGQHRLCIADRRQDIGGVAHGGVESLELVAEWQPHQPCQRTHFLAPLAHVVHRFFGARAISSAQPIERLDPIVEATQRRRAGCRATSAPSDRTRTPHRLLRPTPNAGDTQYPERATTGPLGP